MEMVDGEKFERLVSEYANFNELFKQMSVKQRTSYFVSTYTYKSLTLDHQYSTDEYLPLLDTCTSSRRRREKRCFRDPRHLESCERPNISTVIKNT
jgi:hypothetical protein